MAQKIPFFELFPSLNLTWKQRVTLEGACITGAEIQREKRRMDIMLSVFSDLEDEKEGHEQLIANSYQLEKVNIQQRIEAAVQEPATKGKSDGNEVIMGGPIRAGVIPMTDLNPKMGGVVVAGRVFFADMYETRRPGVFCLTFDITDFNSSVRVTKYMQKEEKSNLKKDIKSGM